MTINPVYPNYPFIYLSLYLSTHPIYPSIHPFIHRATTTPGATPPTMSMAVLTLIIVASQRLARGSTEWAGEAIIVASLSAVVGAIYLLIYFKSIKPMSRRSIVFAEWRQFAFPSRAHASRHYHASPSAAGQGQSLAIYATGQVVHTALLQL